VDFRCSTRVLFVPIFSVEQFFALSRQVICVGIVEENHDQQSGPSTCALLCIFLPSYRLIATSKQVLAPKVLALHENEELSINLQVPQAA
jgi:hypothetical protein